MRLRTKDRKAHKTSLSLSTGASPRKLLAGRVLEDDDDDEKRERTIRYLPASKEDTRNSGSSRCMVMVQGGGVEEHQMLSTVA